MSSLVIALDVYRERRLPTFFTDHVLCEFREHKKACAFCNFFCCKFSDFRQDPSCLSVFLNNFIGFCHYSTRFFSNIVKFLHPLWVTTTTSSRRTPPIFL